jgi:polysaccharide deacetylase family protein (PEP-CTERM system associated)
VTNAFTIDVEEWFHVCGVPAYADPRRWDRFESRVAADTRRVLDLLDACGVRATCFVVGWVAERHPEVVTAIRDAGHEIGSHGQWHRRVYELDPDEFTRDLRLATAALQAAGAGPITQFRAPEWSINGRAPWALERLAAEGFTVDSSRAPLRVVGDPMYPRAPHCIATAHGPITEVPPAVERRLGQATPFGGGWGMRLARPSRTLREIARRNARGEPVTCWIHPWELDPDPPRMTLPAGVAFAHYFRLSGWRDRLREVLRGAPFGTMTDMLASLPAPPRPS